ncbi:glycosyltransferase family 39 protein [Paenibacillus chibensis]|uniref:glycosyltransferase family 39 protein n=1 Tax=Paenibacillus chibensis TaxID=59846 RepID=UPI000FDAE7CF|nr:glycosyltransferase family 39 protein [Paenibacillus chibensis]MEC0369249.1 glycosyltransferase family 39 protein [Paenibacillus chibensis]
MGTTKSRHRIDVMLVIAVLLAVFFSVYGIWDDQFVNAYYTSAVKSMLQSFHNFFYASFDPGGYVTVDKPPVAFWLQTLSAMLFGFRGWSVILPQALAYIGSTLMIYVLIKPTFGIWAARLASLAMACMPVAVAVARTNNVDSLLVFTLLLGIWMLFRGIRQKKSGWILGAFAMVGVGFNIKMLQAYMVVPAFYLLYLLSFRTGWKKKWITLAGATVTLALVSVSWAVIVDSVPASERPYIGSSQTNSVLELAFGYNGVSRLTGNRGTGGGMNPGDGGKGFSPDEQTQRSGSNTVQSSTNGPGGTAPGNLNGDGPGSSGRGFSGGPGGGMPPGMNGRGGAGGGMFNTGSAGPLRLFQQELSGQASWLLPFVLMGSIALLAGWRWRQEMTDGQKETLFWLAWLIPVMGFFSIAGFFHQYYLVMMGPPIAALTGAGWSSMWKDYRSREGWRSWLLPAAILGTTAFEAFILQAYTDQIGPLLLIVTLVVGIGSAALLVIYRKAERRTLALAAAGLILLLLAPGYWSATPIIYGQSSQLPAAGPGESKGGGRMTGTVNEALLEYLTEHNTGEKYLFAVSSAQSAAPYIIRTGNAVMAMGGYSGSDPILTVDGVKKLVQDGKIKYFLLSGQGQGGMGRESSSDVTAWIKANATEVPASEWGGGSDSGQTNGDSSGSGSSGGGSFRGGMDGGTTLYEIQSGAGEE